MRKESIRSFRISFMLCWLVASAAFAWLLAAQSPEMQARIAEVKEAAAKNKQLLAQYTWVEQDTIIPEGRREETGALPSSSWT